MEHLKDASHRKVLALLTKIRLGWKSLERNQHYSLSCPFISYEENSVVNTAFGQYASYYARHCYSFTTYHSATLLVNNLGNFIDTMLVIVLSMLSSEMLATIPTI